MLILQVQLFLVHSERSNVMEKEVDKLNEVVKDSQLIMHLEEFDELCKENSNYAFWMTCVSMIRILLDFTITYPKPLNFVF